MANGALRLSLTSADWMVLRAAIETVLADPDPPPAVNAGAPSRLCALLGRLTEADDRRPLRLLLTAEDVAALRYALAYQMRIRGYVVGRPGAINAMVELHDKLEALAAGRAGRLARLLRRR